MRQSKNKKAQKKQGEVRIIAGSMRGRKLHFSAAEGLRPTLDRIRETLFNWLAKDIHNSVCLDLFAGSGALGFESISRGAKAVFLIEDSSQVVKDLHANAKSLNNDNLHIKNMSANQFLSDNKQKFNIVFLDPPFGKGLLEETLKLLQPHLAPDALVYIEQEKTSTAYVPNKDWQQVKFKKTASFSYALYQLAN